MSYVTDQLEAGETYLSSTLEIRWHSNDRCLPKDCVQELYDADLITLETLEETIHTGDIETSAAIAQYIRNQENRTPEQVAEERFEMRAAFGTGETVVNVFTGEKTEL